MPYPSSKDKSRVVRSWFEAKLKELGRIAELKRKRKAIREWYPLTLAEFRRWEVEEKFGSWVSQSIDAPGGSHPILAGKVAAILAELNSDPVLEENQRLLRENATLIAQNLELEASLLGLRDALALLGEKRQHPNVIRLYRGPAPE